MDRKTRQLKMMLMMGSGSTILAKQYSLFRSQTSFDKCERTRIRVKYRTFAISPS